MEAVRRVGGSVLFLLVLLFSFFPLVADRMPEMLGHCDWIEGNRFLSRYEQ